MSNITFTKEEYQHLADSFDRIRQSLSKLSPADWDKGNNPLIKQITVKFTRAATEYEEYIVILKRQHIRLLEEYTNATIKRLNEVIIPAYERRGDKEDYVQKSKQLVALVTGIRSKLEAAL